MSFKIRLSKDAKKALDNLDEKGKQRVLGKVKDFSEWMSGKNVKIDVKKLKGVWEGYYRLRIGRLRVLIEVETQEAVIKVYDIGFRGDIYK